MHRSAIVAELDCDGADPAFDRSPVYSVAPRTRAPIVRNRLVDGNRVREAGLATWGPRPSWAKDKGPRPINARLETVASNDMFRSSFVSSRVICPMTGYYEWQEEHDGGTTQEPPVRER